MREASLRFLFDRRPACGEIVNVCKGIDWVSASLPFALDHVNCWLLQGADEQVLIDTGVNDEPTRSLWTRVFDGFASENKQSHRNTCLRALPEAVLVTHYHPDHIGLAGEFARQGCRLIGSQVETAKALELYTFTDEDYAQRQAHWYREHGLPESVVRNVKAGGNTFRKRISEPPALSRWECLTESQRVELAGHDYQVLTGRGHAPDMLLLFRESDHVLIAADQVLPQISPNVSVPPDGHQDNPLEQFLGSLKTLRMLPEDTLVLPSHGIPFRGLRSRIDQLLDHHQRRLDQLLCVCTEPMTAFDLFDVLFGRTLDDQQTFFALGESLAHLHYLEFAGHLRRFEDAGVTRFVRNQGLG